MKKWDVVRKFVLTRGELNLEAESHLTKNSIRRSGVGEMACYIQYGIIETENPDQAAELTRARLDALIGRYDVDILVFEFHCSLVPQAT